MSSLLFSLSLSLEREREQQSATRALFYTEDIFPTNETKEEKEKKNRAKSCLGYQTLNVWSFHFSLSQEILNFFFIICTLLLLSFGRSKRVSLG